MNFEQAERVNFEKNPILSVIFQARFPRNMSINNQQPAEFQKLIMDEFPSSSIGFEYLQEVKIDGLDTDMPVPSLLPMAQTKNYKFENRNKTYAINLTQTFISVSSTDYKNWEELRKYIVLALDALEATFPPAYYERIGLRYINCFSRIELCYQGISWNELIRSNLLGILSTTEDEKFITAMNCVTEVKMSDSDCRLKLISTLGNTPKYGKELCMIIDYDMSTTSQISREEAMVKLEYFHSESTKIFHWAITDKLIKALNPHMLRYNN